MSCVCLPALHLLPYLHLVPSTPHPAPQNPASTSCPLPCLATQGSSRGPIPALEQACSGSAAFPTQHERGVEVSLSAGAPSPPRESRPHHIWQTDVAALARLCCPDGGRAVKSLYGPGTWPESSDVSLGIYICLARSPCMAGSVLWGQSIPVLHLRAHLNPKSCFRIPCPKSCTWHPASAFCFPLLHPVSYTLLLHPKSCFCIPCSVPCTWHPPSASYFPCHLSCIPYLHPKFCFCIP